MNLMRSTVCSCVLLVIAAGTSSANICPLKVTSTSQIRGQVNAYEDLLGNVPVQAWKSDSGGGKIYLIAESKTDSSGHFSFPNIPFGWYRLVVPLPGFDGDDFLVHLQGSSMFRWLPRNWLLVGLGITSLHCPETYMKAARKNTPPREAEQQLQRSSLTADHSVTVAKNLFVWQ
jgi:hypothetical protein